MKKKMDGLRFINKKTGELVALLPFEYNDDGTLTFYNAREVLKLHTKHLQFDRKGPYVPVKDDLTLAK